MKQKVARYRWHSTSTWHRQTSELRSGAAAGTAPTSKNGIALVIRPWVNYVLVPFCNQLNYRINYSERDHWTAHWDTLWGTSWCRTYIHVMMLFLNENSLSILLSKRNCSHSYSRWRPLKMAGLLTQINCHAGWNNWLN